VPATRHSSSSVFLDDVDQQVILKGDLGLLKFDPSGRAIVTPNLKSKIIKKGHAHFQNKDGPFEGEGRNINTNWFKKKIGSTGTLVTRSWLAYSPSKKSAYCIPCIMFSTKNTNLTSFETNEGFNKWKKSEKLNKHEKNLEHRNAFTVWKQHEANVDISNALSNQMKAEAKKWREILVRIIDCLKFLALHNDALRGHIESLLSDESQNSGNFLGLFNFLAKYDQVTAHHLQRAKDHPNSVNYLSPTIQNEILH
jgi:hypothetical protein